MTAVYPPLLCYSAFGLRCSLRKGAYRLGTAKSYHEESFTLRDSDYEGDPLGEQSHVLPWALVTLNTDTDVEFYMTSLREQRTNDVAEQLTGYISS